MDLPGPNQRFDINDIVHPLCFPNPNTNLLEPIRPRMPQLPIYNRYGKTPENDFETTAPLQEKEIQMPPRMGTSDETNTAAPPPPARTTTETDEIP